MGHSPNGILKVGVMLIIAALGTVLPTHVAIAQERSILPIDIHVPHVGSAFPADGHSNLVYELHVTNYWKRNLVLERVEVFDQSTDALVSNIEGAQLGVDLYRPGNPPETSDPRFLEAGRVVVVYIWLKLEVQGRGPDQLYHRLHFSVADSHERDLRTVDGGLITVPHDDPIVLSTLFDGGYWMLGSGPSNSSDHRRTVLAVDGKTWLLQRFAFDAMRLGEDGKVVRGDSSINENWVSYGATLHAVADGTVSLVIDDIPDNTPLSPQRAVPMSRETHVGNCVVLDIGDRHFALYAHLKAGSIPFSVGDEVRRGDAIGKIGNSGNSEAPHVHFSIGNTGDPFSAEGMPYVFESFDLVGIQKPPDDEFLTVGIEVAGLDDATRTRHEHEMPLGDSLIQFPAAEICRQPVRP